MTAVYDRRKESFGVHETSQVRRKGQLFHPKPILVVKIFPIHINGFVYVGSSGTACYQICLSLMRRFIAMLHIRMVIENSRKNFVGSPQSP